MKSAPKVQNELLTVQEVVEFLRVSRNTVYRWMQEGKLPYIRIGNVRRIEHNDLSKFLAEHKEA